LLQISEKDEPILQHLLDISTEDLPEENDISGYRLTFKFAKNPFFNEEVLVRPTDCAEVPVATKLYPERIVAGAALCFGWPLGSRPFGFITCNSEFTDSRLLQGTLQGMCIACISLIADCTSEFKRYWG
jgi:hypothetical protein